MKIGPNTAPSVPTHTNGRDRLGTLLRRGEVGTHVATLQGRRLAGAEQHHADARTTGTSASARRRRPLPNPRSDEERGDEPGRRPWRRMCADDGIAVIAAPSVNAALAGSGEAVVAEQIARQQRDDGDHAATAA